MHKLQDRQNSSYFEIYAESIKTETSTPVEFKRYLAFDPKVSSPRLFMYLHNTNIEPNFHI